VLERRPSRPALDPFAHQGVIVEPERAADGTLVNTATVFLTGRECPWRCVMCDLWTHTISADTPGGAIPRQIASAITTLRQAPAMPTVIKLYNAGSFFDPAAIPPEEDDEIAAIVNGFERVIVEAHPAFLRGPYGERCLRFRDRLRGQLEVAIGLETAHASTLARLNKRMTVESFREACAFLVAHDMDVRVFVLLNPPFLTGDAAIEWARRSIDLAAECGATACTVIPTRGGNGAMEALDVSEVERPSLAALERVLEYGVSVRRLRVFADLWDVEQFFDCDCSERRATRLHQINRTQEVPASTVCARCGTLGSRASGVGN
jgi:radical SAM enzyme (TIGR01210 family)